MAGSEVSYSQWDTIVLTFHLVIWSHGKFIDSLKYKIYSIAKLDVGFEEADYYFAFYFCSVVCMI